MYKKKKCIILPRIICLASNVCMKSKESNYYIAGGVVLSCRVMGAYEPVTPHHTDNQVSVPTTTTTTTGHHSSLFWVTHCWLVPAQ